MRPCDPPARARAPRAFTLIELLVVIAIIALLVAILLPSLGAARKTARTATCTANLKMFNLGFQNYSGEGKGLIASFSWQYGKPTPTSYQNLYVANPSATQAHARQGIEIVRRLGKDDTLIPNASIADQRILARNFTQLVLMDGGYYGERNPEPAAACSEDRDLLQWQKLTPTQAQAQIPAWDYGAPAAFAPYYSSYQIVPNAFQDEKGPGQLYAVPDDYRLYYTPANAVFKQRRLDEVSFPSQKVVWFDMFDRHFYKQQPIWYAYPQARQPLAFFDGSVQVKKTIDANPGWQHNSQNSPNPSTVTYRPINPTDPPALYSNATLNTRAQYYRWTRKGLRGVDFGGREVR